MKARFTVTAVVELPDDQFGDVPRERIRWALENEIHEHVLNWLGKNAVDVKSTATIEGGPQ